MIGKGFIMYFLVLLVVLGSCAKREVFENSAARYRLVLKSDSTYKLRYPTVIHTHHERGRYQISNDTIRLINGEHAYFRDSIILKTKDWKGLDRDVKLIKK